jgi:NAD(P)-dependent dehydrogenase (short-subunit alcohol dehydrogenase family)
MPNGRALVTGGGSGIGLAVALALARTGYAVVIAGRDERKLKATGLEFVRMDVTDEQSVEAALAQCGPVDVFIANAGGAETAPWLKTSRDMFERMLALNLTSAHLCARAALPGMIARGSGRFIAIGSTASLKGYAYTSAYSAAKHGLLGYVRSLAAELAQTGVTANVVCPGFTDTPLVADAAAKVGARTGKAAQETLAAFAAKNPLGRLIRPDEVAAAVLWLASDEAAAVNGQAIVIDGGETSQ